MPTGGASGGGGGGDGGLRFETQSGNIDVTNSGLFALGSIVGSESPRGLVSVGFIRISAGHDVDITGNLTASGIALGGGPFDAAFGTIDVRAGLAGSGSILMAPTDLGAFALAEPGGHHASAGVALNAHNNILVQGSDPVASALAGTQAAILQTHSNADLHHAGSNGSADAFIHVIAGGTAVFMPP